jgi:hypothetical protein
MSEIAWSFVIFFALVAVVTTIVLRTRAKWRRDAEELKKDEHVESFEELVDVREVQPVDPPRRSR